MSTLFQKINILKINISKMKVPEINPNFIYFYFPP